MGKPATLKSMPNEIRKTKTMLNKILAKHTGKTIKTIAKDTERDYFLDAKEAVGYGLVDQVLATRQHNT